MEDQERIYNLISNSNGLTKDEIRKKLKIKEKTIRICLDSLYKNGLIDWERGVYKIVPEEKIRELYLQRNVDLEYLKNSVDWDVVDALWNRELSSVLQESEMGLEDKIVDLERKIKVLESLKKSLLEMRKIR
jgi:predicted transcriptional regulator